MHYPGSPVTNQSASEPSKPFNQNERPRSTISLVTVRQMIVQEQRKRGGRQESAKAERPRAQEAQGPEPG